MSQGNQNGMTEEKRDCWRTARERERLRARFHIRERVAEAKDATTTPRLEDPASHKLLCCYIHYIKAGDRSKFSLSKLDRQFDLISSRIPTSFLYSTMADINEEEWSLEEHTFRLCMKWFGEDYAQKLREYMSSLETFTIMEYAAWMGKYSIVSALLLAGVNPCRRGRHNQYTTRTHGDAHDDWSISMGARVIKRFFDCFPQLLSTYLVEGVVELRREGWARRATIVDVEQHGCLHCQQQSNGMEGLLCFSSCQHWICEICLWNDLLENLDQRGDWNDVLVCPHCGQTNKSCSMNQSCVEPTTSLEDWIDLTCYEKRERSLSKFNDLPADRKALKSSAGKKKRASPQSHSASSWRAAVLPSLGSTQAVRRDKFFTSLERNSVQYVRGCLYAGVNVDWTNEYGQTALHISVWRGSEAIASLLLEFGANPRHAANDGTTPMEIAILLGHENLRKLLEDFESCPNEMGDIPSKICPSHLPSLSLPVGALATLIPIHTDHPGAGSYTIDGALSSDQIAWLLSLHGRIPVDRTQKQKAGLCSERSYFCDATGSTRTALEFAIRSAGLTNQNGRVQVFPHMRFLDYSIAGTTLNPHVDICRIDPISGLRSTHTFILYLTDCPQGGETSLLGEISGEERSRILARVSPQRGRLLLFPHACPHEGNEVRDVPKILLRGEVHLENN